MATPAEVKYIKHFNCLAQSAGANCPIDFIDELKAPPAPYQDEMRGLGSRKKL